MTHSEMQTVLRDTAPEHPITFRPLFGGYGGYVEGRIFASLYDERCSLKLPPDAQEELLHEPGATRVQYAPDMPPSKHYVAVPDAFLTDDARFAPWVKRSIAYVLTLPAPKKRAKATK